MKKNWLKSYYKFLIHDWKKLLNHHLVFECGWKIPWQSESSLSCKISFLP